MEKDDRGKKKKKSLFLTLKLTFHVVNLLNLMQQKVFTFEMATC